MTDLPVRRQQQAGRRSRGADEGLQSFGKAKFGVWKLLRGLWTEEALSVERCPYRRRVRASGTMYRCRREGKEEQEEEINGRINDRRDAKDGDGDMQARTGPSSPAKSSRVNQT